MSALLHCPEIACWPALVAATLPPDQWERCERHLESCAACQERLRRAEGLWGALRTRGRQFGDPTREAPGPHAPSGGGTAVRRGLAASDDPAGAARPVLPGPRRPAGRPGHPRQVRG